MAEADGWNIGPIRQTELRNSVFCPTHRYASQVALEIDEIEHTAVASPDRLRTPFAGNHHTSWRVGHGANRHFRPSRIPRHVGDPLAIGRESRVLFIKLGSEQRLGAAFRLRRSDPDVPVARVAIGDPDGRWEVALVGRNLTDEIYSAWYEPLVGAGLNTGWFATTARPRQLGVQLRLGF